MIDAIIIIIIIIIISNTLNNFNNCSSLTLYSTVVSQCTKFCNISHKVLYAQNVFCV